MTTLTVANPYEHDSFANKNEEFYSTTMNDMPHQLFAAGLQARDIYPELENFFSKKSTWT